MSEQFGTPEISSDDKLWAALAYVLPLVPIILLLIEEKRDRPFIRFHALHALIISIILSIITAFTFGCGTLFWVVMFFFAYKAYQGEMVKIPLISDFIKDQGWV